jgi:hypothetical protein
MPHGTSCSVLPGIAWGLMFELKVLEERILILRRPGTTLQEELAAE